jgi:hypothetical protein
MIMPATDVGLSCPPVAERHAFWVVIATVVESEATDTIAKSTTPGVGTVLSSSSRSKRGTVRQRPSLGAR